MKKFNWKKACCGEETFIVNSCRNIDGRFVGEVETDLGFRFPAYFNTCFEIGSPVVGRRAVRDYRDIVFVK